MASKKVFSLEGRVLKLDTASDLEPYIAGLRTNNDVEEVILQGNTLGVGACKALGEVLATKKNLRVANFADIFTGRLLNEIPEALDSLLQSILNLPKLTTINLNDNAFGLNVQAPLVAFLGAHVPLQHLYLNNNGLGPHAGILIATALSSLHDKKEEARKQGQTVPDLETVICGRNRLENGSMMAWAAMFSKHNRVREVKMVQNGIRQEGISHLLSEGLNGASGLRVLDLQDNTFTLPGATALAKAVSGWTDLEELAVGDSLLKGKGAALLAEALNKGKNKKLETLRLAYNDITSEGLKGFGKAAKEALPALKKMELNGNKFSEDNDTVIALLELLEERREKLGRDVVLEDEWGMDNLSDLEGEFSDDEDGEDEEEDIEREDRVTRLEKAAGDAQRRPVIQPKDKDVDALTKRLEATSII